MENITVVIKSLYPNIDVTRIPTLEIPSDEIEARQCEEWNKSEGGLKGYDCPTCKNRGLFYSIQNGVKVARECECMNIRRTLKRIEASGLKDDIAEMTFDAYKATEDWQVKLKESAMKYAAENSNKWFFVGGQSGAGKTHLCTAIVAELLKTREAIYMSWREVANEAKASINDAQMYADILDPLKHVDVLYIDDFLKVPNGKERPSDGDLNLAFELINHRANRDKLVTVISSERTISQILSDDSAVGGRIYKRAKDYCWKIDDDPKKNYRIR
jgi:DNA replication protein DnaC